MADDKAAQARELHRTLEYIGLRAQATTVGLIQLCTELVTAGVLGDDAVGGSRTRYTGSLRFRVRVAVIDRNSTAC